jgi:hypothetical protein
MQSIIMKCLNTEDQKAHTSIMVQMHIEYFLLVNLITVVIVYISIFFWNPIFCPLTPSI